MNGNIRQILKFLSRWLTPFFDPIGAMRSIVGLPRYIGDWHRYSKMGGAEPLSLMDSQPQLHDWTVSTGFDAHYFYMSGWAMRGIVSAKPVRHVDAGSHNMFVNLLSAVVPVDFIDIRPLDAEISGLNCISGSALSMPYDKDSVASLSCLHTAEHIGLGRYGDPLDPRGTIKAAMELTRVLSPGGNLFFAVPVGQARVCFNAHRVIDAAEVLKMFGELELVEFSVVDDKGRFHRNTRVDEFSSCRYACGMFWFRKSLPIGRSAGR